MTMLRKMINKTSNIPFHKLSLVIPVFNEEENISILIDQIQKALENYNFPWELIIVDDGSTDKTFEVLKTVSLEKGKHVRILELARNFKQTAATQAGIDFARGDVIVTMDGDLQNDSKDIVRMVNRLLLEDLDLVAGWRKDRKDGLFFRRIPSIIANWIIAKITGVKLKDYGCSLKVFRSVALKKLRLYGDMHRFIPAWLATVTTPKRIAEETVLHHPRIYGKSKYGISRTIRVIVDLVFVYFFMRFRSRPGHFFGGIGISLVTTGIIILSYLLFLKIILYESIGGRPLLFVGFFLLIAGIQMITSGVIAEILARIFFETGQVKSYLVRSGDEPISYEKNWHEKNSL